VPGLAHAGRVRDPARIGAHLGPQGANPQRLGDPVRCAAHRPGGPRRRPRPLAPRHLVRAAPARPGRATLGRPVPFSAPRVSPRGNRRPRSRARARRRPGSSRR
jgi:hypothetical protein